MKVLHVYKDYYPPVKGGIEMHINILANGLKAKGIDVHVLVSNTINKLNYENHNNITIAKAPQLGRLFSSPISPTFYKYLINFGRNAEILHFHYPNPIAEFSYLMTSLKKKIIVTYHSDIIRQNILGKLYSPFRDRFLRLSDSIIATSPNYIQSSTVLKKFKEKCTVIPLGIDTEAFRTLNDFEKIDRIRSEFGGKCIILFVGCLRYYKGLHLLISAMEMVNSNLLIVGKGPEEEKLKKLAISKNLANKVFFLGELGNEDLKAYYKACDIFILPSHIRSEAFGIVQLEAMICGKPVISTELGTGTSFVNIDQKTGYNIKPNDKNAIAAAINHLIENPEKRNLYGLNGAQRVSMYFTADKMIEKTAKLYEQVCKEVKQ